MNARVRIKLGSQRLTVAEVARRIGISPMGLWNRLKRGVSREQLLAPGYGPRRVQQIVREHGSAFGAALHDDLTADEYLAVTSEDK